MLELVIAFLLGGFAGAMAMALLVASRDADDRAEQLHD